MIFIMSAPFSHTPSHPPLTPLSLLDQTPVPVVAIVGYTNAGKSTLLNTLTQVWGGVTARPPARRCGEG
jgi:GTP-binding protein EngB required for normal cell division